MPKIIRNTPWGDIPMEGPRSYGYYLDNSEVKDLKNSKPTTPHCEWLEPNPAVTSQKSFYHRAYVEYGYNCQILYSYETPVAALVGCEMLRLWSDWSATTARHVQSFFGARISKAEWLNMEVHDLREVNQLAAAISST